LQSAIQAAETQLGVPYEWGGATPGVGFDCSGLVQWAYGQVGVSFPHLAQDQYNMTQRVPVSGLSAGDLVFFGSDPSDVSHVGIYLGNGQMIDAPNSTADVRVESIYWNDLLGGGAVG
jgi:cell wall-associated NlpC family hydrolase